MFPGFGNPAGSALLILNDLLEIAARGATHQHAALVNLGLADANGQLTLSAWGADQNVTVAPSGTGGMVLTSGSLQMANNQFQTWKDSGGTVRALNGFNASNVFLLNQHGSFNTSINLNGGDCLIGTSTDNSNGRLQLASHTTSAGGVGLGADVYLYRSAASSLTTNASFFVGAFAQIRASDGAVITSGAFRSGASSDIQWTGRSIMRSPADGQITILNQAETSFSRLNLGGTTNAFPAIKRNGAALNFRLADDSGDAGITAGSATFSGDITLGNAYVGGAPAATGYVVVKDSGGNSMKLLCSNV